jgi:hypothetical protein
MDIQNSPQLLCVWWVRRPAREHSHQKIKIFDDNQIEHLTIVPLRKIMEEVLREFHKQKSIEKQELNSS